MEARFRVAARRGGITTKMEGVGAAALRCIWMTFFNGYTAVLLSNTAWGLGATAGYQLMESSFLPALTP